MKSSKYHKIRLSEAWKVYRKFLRDHILLEFLFIGTATITNIVVSNKYYDVLTALIYECGGLVIIFGILFLWKSLRVVPERIYNKQQDIIKTGSVTNMK